MTILFQLGEFGADSSKSGKSAGLRDLRVLDDAQFIDDESRPFRDASHGQVSWREKRVVGHSERLCDIVLVVA